MDYFSAEGAVGLVCTEMHSLCIKMKAIPQQLHTRRQLVSVTSLASQRPHSPTPELGAPTAPKPWESVSPLPRQHAGLGFLRKG